MSCIIGWELVNKDVEFVGLGAVDILGRNSSRAVGLIQ